MRVCARRFFSVRAKMGTRAIQGTTNEPRYGMLLFLAVGTKNDVDVYLDNVACRGANIEYGIIRGERNYGWPFIFLSPQ